MEYAHGNAGAVERISAEEAVIAHVVDGEDHRDVSDQRIVAVGGSQQHGHESGLPIVTMEYIRAPHVLGDFDGRAAKLAVTFGVVWIVAAGAAIEAIAIKIGGVVHEKITYSADHGTIGDGWKTEACAAHRNRDAGHDHGANLHAAVAGQHDRDFVPEANQGFWQGLDHVR